MTPYKTARCIFVPEAPLIGTGVNISLVSGKRDPLPSAASDGALDPTHASTMTFPDFCEGPGKWLRHRRPCFAEETIERRRISILSCLGRVVRLEPVVRPARSWRAATASVKGLRRAVRQLQPRRETRGAMRRDSVDGEAISTGARRY
jgi:hypothetical protein